MLITKQALIILNFYFKGHQVSLSLSGVPQKRNTLSFPLGNSEIENCLWLNFLSICKFSIDLGGGRGGQRGM